MENIAAPVHVKPASAPFDSKRGQGFSLDKALFDAFMSIDSQANNGGKKKTVADILGAEKPSRQGSEIKVDEPALQQPRTKEHDADKEITCSEERDAERALPKEEKVILPRVATALRHALKDPETLSKLKQFLALDESASPEDVIQAMLDYVRDALDVLQELPPQEAMAHIANPPDKDNKDSDIVMLVLQMVGGLLTLQRQNLEEAEQKLRTALNELMTIGSANSDDAVDATVERNLDALDAWKAAQAAAGTPEVPVDDDSNINKQMNAILEQLARRTGTNPGADNSHNHATGGRLDASLANSQPSANQTLPLLPTQLTGGQQRLTVAPHNAANQNWLGSNNLDAMLRPLSAAGLAAHSADAAGKMAKAARQNSALPQVYEQVAVRLNRMAKAGEKSLSIQLNPAELGRVEVKLDFAKDAHVTARLMADSQQTLDLLRQESRALERALTDAGFKLDQNSLQFDLRDQHDSRKGFADAMHEKRLWQENTPSTPLQAEEVIINVSPAAMLADGRIDMHI